MSSTDAVSSSSPPVDVKVLGPDDAAAAARLLAVGFAEEPGNLALFPDVASRTRLVEVSATSTLRPRLPRGTVHGAYVDGALAAIAVWDAPASGTGSVTDLLHGLGTRLPLVRDLRRDIPHALAVVRGGASEALKMGTWRRTAVAEASRGSAWHLAFLATDPQHRGKGLARRLLDRQLDRCDEDGLPVWLETTDPVNPPIYERFGFVSVAHRDRPAWWPGWWIMRREPRGDA
jgi:GNAT superfamily N-acetyltransferase